MSATHCCCMTRKLHIRHGGRIRRALARKMNKSSEMPPPVSLVAIRLCVATIGSSIGLDAGIFRDVAAEA